MKFEADINYIQSLASITRQRMVKIEKNKKRSFNSEYVSEDIPEHMMELHGIIGDFSDKLSHLNSQILVHLADSDLSVRYETLLNTYLSLVKDMFHALLNKDNSISNKLVLIITSLLAQISDVSVDVYNASRNNSTIGIKPTYLSSIIEARVLLDSEIKLSMLDSIRAEYSKRIDIEIDLLNKNNKNNINEISKTYSDARQEIIHTYGEYEASVNRLIGEAKEVIEDYKIKFSIKGDEINNKNKMLDGLLLDAEKKLEIVHGVLQKTNQAGMAAAFQSRHDELKWPMVTWIVMFFICLGGLAIWGAILVQSAFSSELKTVAELLSKLSVTFPLIWGAWFSAKQYSHISQLREDYAYKVAVAMTYHGYKDEAADVNKDMSGKLLDSIISQFSDNPVRLYQNNNSASVFEAMLKNDKVSDIINSAKSGVNGSAK
ncbi:TPA: hypothetical protein ACW7Y0_001065 [Aeromonas hydrophila]